MSPEFGKICPAVLRRVLSSEHGYNHANFLGERMKTFLNIVGIILILAGGTFFLQGINVLPGSYMTGDPQWAINGAIMIVVALGLLFWANRRK